MALRLRASKWPPSIDNTLLGVATHADQQTKKQTKNATKDGEKPFSLE